MSNLLRPSVLTLFWQMFASLLFLPIHENYYDFSIRFLEIQGEMEILQLIPNFTSLNLFIRFTLICSEFFFFFFLL